jgi:DNA (cytosine-5)-methyltransferase 1
LRTSGTALSLFTGAMGLDLGLEAAGFRVIGALDSNPIAAKTIARNRPDVPVINGRLEDVSTADLLELAGADVGAVMVVSGGPSCQSFSTAGQRRSLGDPRGILFREFVRVVAEAKPRFFVMENVRGILSAAIRHRPLAERGPGKPVLEADECYGSAFLSILGELQATGYSLFFDLLNAADYGAAQRRQRLVIIGSRDGERVVFPKPTHSKEPTDGLSPWVTLREALQGLDDPAPLFTPLPPSKRNVMALVPEGGNWRDLPAERHPEILGRAFHSWGGRTGFYRRLSWDEPTPALTTRPDSKATMLCHPVDLRPLSIREYARIQQFPDDWVFEGSVAKQYEQIGNAVPVGLGRVAGEAIRLALRHVPGRAAPGQVYCDNADLLRRLGEGAGTVLNPRRMRKGSTDLMTTRTWMKGVHENRSRILELVGPWIAGQF